MNAIVKRGARVVLARVPGPTVVNNDDVLIHVALTGICRTDLYVADGRITGGPDPLILGHEFVGTVAELGQTPGELRIGDRVAVFPWIACRVCADCLDGRPLDCPGRQMLGVDRDGGFAEFVVVPSSVVYRIPDSLSDRAGAYVEPVAAALAVLNAGISADQSGLIHGRNRFAVLVARILASAGFDRVSLHDPSTPGSSPEPHSFDFVIETFATAQAMAEVIRAVKPRGTVVLKSRQPWPAPIDLRAAIAKELTFRAVNYGRFERAISLLAEREIEVDDLFGRVYPFSEFAEAFEEAERSESAKIFLSPGRVDVRDR